MSIASLYTERNELTHEIANQFRQRGVTALRRRLSDLNQRLAQLDYARRRMKVNIDSQNAHGRADWHVEDVRGMLAALKQCDIQRGWHEELTFHCRQLNVFYVNAIEEAARQYPTHPNARPFAAWNRANATLRSAIEDGVIERAGAHFDKRGRGGAINHDLYAYSADGTLILVQVRHATVTKYGTSVKIQYFVTDGDDAVEIVKGKANIKKAAQADPAPDSPLRFVRPQLKSEWRNKLDETPVKLPAPRVGVYEVYKILHDDNGTLRSVYSGEEYQIGKTKTQRAQPEHGGGYYAFLSAEKTLEVAQAGNVFGDGMTAGKKLVLCKGRGFGKPVVYSNSKHAFSRIVIDEIVCEYND